MAPVVVLLHAFPLDARLWDGVAGPLSEDDWDVVVPDLLGFGGSRLPEDFDEDPSLVHHARAVLSMLDRLGVAEAVFCGLSLGGYVAMEIARQDPDRISGLALVDTKATADGDEARAQRHRVADQVLESGSTAVLERAMLPNLLGATTHASRPEVVERVLGPRGDAADAGVESEESRQARCRAILEQDRLDPLAAHARRYGTTWLVGVDRQLVSRRGRFDAFHFNAKFDAYFCLRRA